MNVGRKRSPNAVIDMVLKTLGSFILTGGGRPRVNVLYYHRVVEAHDPMNDSVPDVATFRWQMALLKKYFNVLPLSEVVARWQDGTLRPRTIAITFDDGYKDNLTKAAPILQELGLPATIFVASGYLKRRLMWNDRLIEAARRSTRREVDLEPMGLGTVAVSSTGDRQRLAGMLINALKRHKVDQREAMTEAVCDALGVTDFPSLMLEPEDLARVESAGFEVGGHTVNHPILCMETPERAEWEINQGKRDLEEILDHPVRLFAFPNGRPDRDYGAAHVEMVRQAGFAAAFSTAPAVIRPGSDPMQLPRFTPWDRTPQRYLGRMLFQGMKSRFRHEGVARTPAEAGP